MAKFVRGNPIPNATGYRLLKKYGDGYGLIYQKSIGKQQIGELNCLINTDGSIVYNQRANFSGMIVATDFDEDDTKTTAVCLTSVPFVGDYLAVAFYTKKDDYSSFVGGYRFEELAQAWTSQFTGANIVLAAKSLKATYVAFCTDVTSDFWIYTPNKINFCLDEYKNPSQLPEGETHQLVVQALGDPNGVDTDGDGKIDTIYEDSQYGGKADANGNPTSEPLVYNPSSN